MSTDKQEIDRIINEIICNGNYSRSIGGLVSRIRGGSFIPASWPKFDENWISNEFYISALKTERLHEWLEHLFSLKLGEPEPIVGLKTISDQQVGRVARAFWRRIYPYRNKYGIELGKDVPIELLSHMATALTWIDEENIKNLQLMDAGEPEPDMFSFAWRKAKVCGIDGIFHSGFDIAKFVFDSETIPRDKWTMTINTAKSLTPRTIKIIRDTENEHGFSWKWVE